MTRYNSEPETDQQLIQSVWPEWELTDQLGIGQYGIVWKARRQGFAGDSFAAVKIVTIGNERNENGFTAEETDAYYASLAHNYAREIRMMESVKGYSNIVNIEDYTVCRNSGGKPWHVLIRMELLTPLYEYMENREITDEEVIRIGSDLCKALEVCAAKKIVHRDIKPANVFVNDDGVFKLGDFGVARQILDVTSQTRTGTPDFMAPEVYNGSLRETDLERAHSADIYSLGMLLYWIANGRRMPFVKQGGLITADEITDAFARKMKGEKLPAPVKASGALSMVILKACAFDVHDRYRSAGEFRQALESIRISSPDPVKNRKKIPFIAAAVLTLVLIAGYFVFKNGMISLPPWGESAPVPTAVPTDIPAPTSTMTPAQTWTPALTDPSVPTPTFSPPPSPSPIPTETPAPTSTFTPTQIPEPTKIQPETPAPISTEAVAEMPVPATAAPTSTVLPGDVTGDGKADLVDLIRILKYLSEGEATGNMEAGDFNGDGTTNLTDVIRFEKKLEEDFEQ